MFECLSIPSSATAIDDKSLALYINDLYATAEDCSFKLSTLEGLVNPSK